MTSSSASSAQDYDFDYEDDDAEDVDADVENKYYQAKNLRSDNPEKALSEWRAIVDGESPKGEWGFKALKQSTKLNFRRARYEEALKVRDAISSAPQKLMRKLFPQVRA